MPQGYYDPNSPSEHSLQFIVDNTYKKLSTNEAKLNKTGEHYKVHDWTLFVDVVAGNPDLIERVCFQFGDSFSPSKFICPCPVPVKHRNGRNAWRFSTRQQTYGSRGTKATISIRGAGGSLMEVEHTVKLHKIDNRKKAPLQHFTERRGAQPLRYVKLPENANFGIELELSSSQRVEAEDVANALPRNAGEVQVTNYSDGRQTYQDGWKLVPDSSIVCNRSMPTCNKFELVSRVLRGGKGLAEVASVVRSIENNVSPKLKVNKSMGFHVHVDVSGFSLDQLIKICQKFYQV